MATVPTADQLRNTIDTGATGEKVSHTDPAAVPLGTDAEAAGNPPTRQERAMEARSQTGYYQRTPVNGVIIYLIIVALIATAILFVGTLA